MNDWNGNSRSLVMLNRRLVSGSSSGHLKVTEDPPLLTSRLAQQLVASRGATGHIPYPIGEDPRFKL